MPFKIVVLVGLGMLLFVSPANAIIGGSTNGSGHHYVGGIDARPAGGGSAGRRCHF
jgi:hypothetical protein